MLKTYALKLVDSIVKAGWRGLLLNLGVPGLILALSSTVLSFIFTVTHEDAVHYLDRTSAARLSNPKPGALYLVEDHRIPGDYLCEYEIENGDVIGREGPPRQYEFYNPAGELLPAMAALNGIVGGGGEQRQERSLGGRFNRKVKVQELTYIGSGRPIKERCERDVVRALDQGKRVCGVDAMMVRYSDGAPYAVKFESNCIVKCAEADDVPCPRNEFPRLDDIAWTTKLKRNLGLIGMRLPEPDLDYRG